MDDGDSMWSRKGATLSGKSARQERGSALVRMESASLRSFAPTCVTGGTHRPGCAATGIRWGGARHLGFAPVPEALVGPPPWLCPHLRDRRDPSPRLRSNWDTMGGGPPPWLCPHLRDSIWPKNDAESGRSFEDGPRWPQIDRIPARLKQSLEDGGRGFVV